MRGKGKGMADGDGDSNSIGDMIRDALSGMWLEPADEHAKRLHRKVRTHIACAIAGFALLLVISFIPAVSGWFGHFLPAVPALPGIAQEIAERFIDT